MKEDKKFIKEKSLDASSDSRTISLFLTIVRRLSSRLEPFSTTSRKWNDPFMIDIQQRSGQFLLCFASVTFSASHQSSKMSENNINHPYVHRKTREGTRKKKRSWFAPSEPARWMARTCPALLIARRLSYRCKRNSATKETPNNLFANFSCCLEEGLVRMQGSVSILFFNCLKNQRRGAPVRFNDIGEAAEKKQIRLLLD